MKLQDVSAMHYLIDRRRMAKQKFTHFVPRAKPKKRGPGAHKKNKNKSEKRQKKQTRYKGQGRV